MSTVPPPVAPEPYCIGLLMEEISEAGTLLGRAVRFGLDTPEGGLSTRLSPPDRPHRNTTRELLAKELGDIIGAANFAIEHGVIDGAAVHVAASRKLAVLMDPTRTDNLGRPLAPQPTKE